MQAAAQSLGVHVDFFEAEEPAEIERAFAAMRQAGAEALFVQENWKLYLQRHQIIALAAQQRLPVMCENRRMAEAGCLMAYATDYRDVWRRAGGYVAKLLKGADPAALPVEQPTKFILAINLKTAKALGLTLSPSLLYQANLVIR